MDDPNITMEEYIRPEEEKARKRWKVFNWETAKYGRIWYDEDVHDLRYVETEFPAIAFNDQISSEKHFLVNPRTTCLKIYKLCDVLVRFANMALPPRDKRHQYLRHEGSHYTDTDIADLEERLGRIYSREIHRLGRAKRRMSWRQFIVALGLHTGEEMESPDFARYWSKSERMIPGKGDLRDYWKDIFADGDFLGPPPSYTLIRDPVLRLCHRMMTHSIAGRSQAPEMVSVTDLFYLRGLDVRSVNIPYLLARYLRRIAAGRKSGALISGGQFVARLAEHFGLLTKEML
ncbi:hypothetical protein Tco_0660777 [Tanacetum coccineum]